MAQNALLHELITTNVGTSAIVLSADDNATGVDTRGFENCEVVWLVGARGDTWDASNYVELEVEDSADNSTFADAANADLTATVTGTNTGTIAKLDAAGDGGQIYRQGYKGTSRYVRGVTNFTGTHSTGTVMGMYYILSQPRSAPTDNPS